MTMERRPNKHSNPSAYYKLHKSKGRFRFIHKKRRETSELLKAVVR